MLEEIFMTYSKTSSTILQVPSELEILRHNLSSMQQVFVKAAF